MKKTNILYSMLAVVSLSVNPLLSTQLSATVTQSTQSNISFNIAKILHNRGIDEDVAYKISNDFLAGEEELFSVLLDNLIMKCSVLSQNEIMEYISSLALQRKNVDLSSYASLVSMVHRIKHQTPNKKVLNELRDIALINNAFINLTVI